MTPRRRRLRVAHVYAHLEVGGIERSIVDLLPRLDPDRFDVRMICTRRRGRMVSELEGAGVPVELCRCTSRLPLAWTARSLARALRESRVDLVHAHAETAAHQATEAARLAGVPMVVATFHTRPGFDERASARECEQWGARSANVYVSEAVLREHAAAVGFDGETAMVIRNGVDVPRYAAAPPAPVLAALRRELRLPPGRPVLLNVARLQRIKAPDDLLRAFALVRARRPGAVLVMAGGGRRQAEVAALVRELGLQDDVRLAGTREDVGALYHLADVHVSASHGEGFSLVVLEAMAAGLPQVLTGVGGTPEAIGESGAARLVRSGAPAELADAVVALLDDSAARAAMGDAARGRALAFDLTDQVVSLERLYDALSCGAIALAR
jgi:glycosyltransferase involved in cell wall biosynthesis